MIREKSAHDRKAAGNEGSKVCPPAEMSGV